MGQATEQKTEFIEAITELVVATKKEPTPMRSEPNMNFSYLLILAVVPVVLGWWLNNIRLKRKKK